MYSTWITLTNQLITEKSVATISDQREYYIIGSIILYSLWSIKLATLFSVTGGFFSAIHIEYMDFLLELGWQFWSRNLLMNIKEVPKY